MIRKFCGNCGRKLEVSWNNCPSCGKEWVRATTLQIQPKSQPQIRLSNQLRLQPHQVQHYQYKYTRLGGEHKFGTGSLISSILGHISLFIGLGFVSLLLFLGSVILGGFGIGKDKNKSLAIAGFVLGFIGLACFIAMVPLWYILLNYYYY
ncbi:MAG: hypothetical protein ACFFB6_06000 [Promethearchaeota archaeon]